MHESFKIYECTHLQNQVIESHNIDLTFAQEIAKGAILMKNGWKMEIVQIRLYWFWHFNP